VDKIKFIDVAQARHSSSKLDSVLTKPQHSRRAGCGFRRKQKQSIILPEK
jgi:hypothetical protein